MADGIQISTAEIEDAAEKIREFNNNMDEDLSQIRTQITTLKDTWESASADMVEAAMDSLKPRFDQYKEIVGRYNAFLTKTAGDYVSTEEANRTNANRLNEAFK